MPMNMLVLTSLICGALALAVQAQSTDSRTRLVTLEADDEHRDLTVKDRIGFQAEPLFHEVSHPLHFARFDGTRGKLHHVDLRLSLVIEHEFSGSVSDGVPLNEKPEPIAHIAGMSSELDVLGPDGEVASSTVIHSLELGCAARGTCRFENHERQPITATIPVDPALFRHGEPVAMTIRLRSANDIHDQICPRSGSWDTCTIHHSRIAMAIPQGGVKLTYHYAPVGNEVSMMGATFVGEAPSRTAWQYLFWVLLAAASLAGGVYVMRMAQQHG
ncbi:hypothetical protein KHP62_08275 [Rhodobacteraceae bacterium NNCM2]|nr:hypothetical protein [Coraliihabitans acroporae]